MRFHIFPKNEMKRGKLLIPNEDRCTVTICDIDEDIVLSSAKKVAKQQTVPVGGEIAVTTAELSLSFSFLAHLSRRLE